MNTNDFSKCRVGDKLWSIQLGDCTVTSNQDTSYPIEIKNSSGFALIYTQFGKYNHSDMHQSLFFSNPNIIAPPEPPRLPDYKPGQWIAVWDTLLPSIRKFIHFESGNKAICETQTRHKIFWPNYCTLEELPEVLAKWGETKWIFLLLLELSLAFFQYIA